MIDQRYGKDQLPWQEYRARLDAAVTLAKTLGFPVGLQHQELSDLLEMAEVGYQHLKAQQATPTPPLVEDLMAPPKHMISDIKAALQRSRDAKAAREREALANGTGVPTSEAQAVPRSDEAQSS